MNVFLTGILPYFYIFNSIIINTSQRIEKFCGVFFDKNTDIFVQEREEENEQYKVTKGSFDG